MNIILIGMRGSGKSTIAKLLSRKLNKTYIDMDDLISQKVNMKYRDFVKKFGWDQFREKESEVANELKDNTNSVIATGGGIILRSKNIGALRMNGKFIYLKTSIDTILSRIGTDKNRPPLTDKKTLEEELKEVWNQRKSLYEQTADFTIETDKKTIEEIANEIVLKLD